MDSMTSTSKPIDIPPEKRDTQKDMQKKDTPKESKEWEKEKEPQDRPRK